MSPLPRGLATDISVARFHLDGVVLGGVAYGILFTLCFQYARLMQSKPNRKNVSWPMSAHLCIIFMLATIGFAGQVKFNEMAFIDIPDAPRGTSVFLTTNSSTRIDIMAWTCYTVMTWIADGLVIYRYAAIWSYNCWMLPLPGIMFTASISLSIAWLCIVTRPNASLTDKAIHLGISFASLTIALNVLLTVLIVGHLLSSMKTVRDTLGEDYARNYINIVAMIIESAALPSILGVVYIILYAQRSPFRHLILPLLCQAQAIAPALILLRVARGQAWSRETMSRNSTRPRASSSLSVAYFASERLHKDRIRVCIESCSASM